MKFRKAVESTAEIAQHLRTGLDALKKAHKDCTNVSRPDRVEGSVDIDTALQPTHPNATRWDYAIGHRINSRDDRVLFAEFHKAQVDEVSRVVKKKQWLDKWMQGKPVDQLRDKGVRLGECRSNQDTPERTATEAVERARAAACAATGVGRIAE